MNTNSCWQRTYRYFAEVFFRSKKGNPCAYHLYMDAVNEEEVYMNIVGKVKRLKYFDRVDRVDIVKMYIMATEIK